jgi:glycosyltransferase involved in cell wall biosynthesis
MKDQNSPKVSIVIPVYNGSNYLSEAIDSALSQTYKNIEIIVVNDGSTDDGKTDAICKSYGKKIRYFKKENGGAATALNYGIDKMKGEYFSWLSHDDIYLPDKVEKQVKFFSQIKNNKKLIPFADYELIDKNSQFLQKVSLNHEELIEKPEYAILRGCINGITLLIPKEAFKEYGYFNTDLKCTQDYDMWRRVMKTYQFIHMKDIFTKTRIHSQQDSNKHPNVVIEGDPLWIDLMREIPLKDKERLEGSEYNFYREMVKFLESGTPYSGAVKFAKKRMLNILNDAKGEISQIKVTVIIPFYNRQKPLIKSLVSLKKQTHQNLEVLLVNDCSTDDLSKLITEINGDKRFRIIDLEENRGPAKARNVGIDNASGEYIAFLDSDDEFLPEKISDQLLQMYLTQYNVSHTSYIRKSSSNSRIENVGLLTGTVIPYIVASCQIATPTVMIKLEYLQKNKLRFREDLRIGEDTCFWLEVLRKTKLLGIDKAYTIVNVNENSASNNNRKQLQGLTNILAFLLSDKEFSAYHHEISNIMIRFLELSREITQEDYPEGKSYGGITFWDRKPKGVISKAIYLIRYQGVILTFKKVTRKYFGRVINKIKGVL